MTGRKKSVSVNVIPNVERAIRDLYISQIQKYPVQSLWASQIGHPCARFLVLEQTHWNTKPKISWDLKMRFSLGDLHGTAIVRDLQDAFEGWGQISIERQEVPIPPNDLGISGRIDAVMVIRGKGRDKLYIPIEIKTMSDAVFGKIKSLRDMMRSDSLYLRKYPGQLYSYMHFGECELGIFVLRNKVSGQYRVIKVKMDHKYMETLLERGKVVQESVALYREVKTSVAKLAALPERLPWTRDVCGRCDHLATCCPDMAQVPGVIDMLGETELGMMLDVRDQTDSERKAWKKADESVQKHFAAVCHDLEPGESRTILAPNHTITIKVSKKKSYDIPESVKEKYAKDGVTFRKKIEKVEGGGDDKT